MSIYHYSFNHLPSGLGDALFLIKLQQKEAR